jgi:hypothetical protein
MHSGQQQQRQKKQSARKSTHVPSHPRDAQRQHQRFVLLPEHPGGSMGHSDVNEWLGNGKPTLPQQYGG